VYFVTRQKSNAVYTVIKIVREKEPEKDKPMMALEEFIDLEYNSRTKTANSFTAPRRL